MSTFSMEAKLLMPQGASSPDTYDSQDSELPRANFVVSRTTDGEVISRYGDIVWDFTVYNHKGQPSCLFFSYWDQGGISPERERLINEIKHIFFILIWLRDRQPLSIGTLQNYLSVIRIVAKFAELRNITLKAVISNNSYFLDFIRSQSSGWLVETLTSLLRLLIKNEHKKFAIKTVNLEIIRSLQKQNNQYRDSLNQTAPIPTRIYSEILSNLLNYLDEWQQVETELMELIHSCYNSKKATIKTNSYNWKTYNRLYNSIINNASSKLKNYVITKRGNITIKAIVSLVTDVQCVCKLVIHAFSGMRDEEAQSLPYHCIEEVISNGQKHFLICGITTKLNHGIAKLTKWVTSKEGYKAILIAQRIASSIYAIHNDKPKGTSDEIFTYPLFISTTYFGFSRKVIEETTTKYRIGTLWSKRDIYKLLPRIEEEDLKELEQIDPHRAWRNEEDFQIGEYWHLKSHQLRRSLALYAQKSGLVSLPTLRRQLQHITNEMSSYYAKGSAFAKQLINDDKNHFANEWQQTQTESAALSYIFNVLMSNTILHGGHVHWVDNRLKDKEGVIITDRKQTLQRFKNGEISYKETIVGGCTKVGLCNQAATNWLQINCLKENCRHLIVSLPKLKRVIIAQEKMIELLDITTLEYRTELSHLKVLKETECKIVQLKGDVNV